MRKETLVALLVMSGAVPSFNYAQNLPADATAPEDASPQLNWPRTVKEDGATIVIYQPQPESWIDNNLQMRAAVAVTPKGKTDATFGVIWISASTEVDKPNRLVTLDDIQITKAAFPQDKANEQQYRDAIALHVPDAAREISLDHLEAGLSASQARETASVEVKNVPPAIIFSKTPSLLVLVDGEPALRQVEGQKLMRVANTRALILLDQTTNRYFLAAMDHWFEAAQTAGPWQPTDKIPAGAEALKDALSKANTIDLLTPTHPETAPKDPPTIYVSMVPAELIQTTGEPEYTPIAGTNLLFAKNTDSALFMYITTQKFYLLVSGRWFTSASLNGPWTFLPAKDLPADFQKIPTNNPKANVLLSIPGTPQAQEAVIANSIPQTATVNIAETHLDVAYDGDPKFVKIDGTTGLTYAVNTSLPVVGVTETRTFWCVQNGVWFSSFSATGPWVVARAVPGVIYTIPISCPIHYITYVRVYGSTASVVYVGYTPGYMGTCVTSDGVVVYGTGYYYPAYVGTVWVGYPPTYGYGAGFACGAVTGFAFGFAAGAIIGDCWSRPYWGPCRGYAHVDINTTNVYHNWHGGVTVASSRYQYNGWTGESLARGGAATFNPYSGRASVGGYQNYLDRSTGDFDAKRGGATYNPNTGVISAGGAHASGNIYNGNGQIDAGRGHYNTNTGNGVAHYDGDIYASHDGNVYRHDDDGWQKRSDGGWQDAQKYDSSFSQNRDNLDQQRTSRDLGQQRFQGAQQSGGYTARSGGRGGGGGFHGRR